MKTVPLHGAKAAGRVALVDDEDYELVMQHRWYVREQIRRGRPSGPYAEAAVRRDGRRGAIFMHNLIAGYVGVDHINHDGLDNQRHNLRAATTRQQNQNRRPHVCGSSQYKGVGWRKSAGRWSARIRTDDARRHLGYFDTELDAARAYDFAARKLFGPFAVLNLPEEQPAIIAAELAAEALAADTIAALGTVMELVRSGNHCGALAGRLGDARVLDCLAHAAQCVLETAQVSVAKGGLHGTV